MNSIILIGFMGSGKTTVGRLLAKKLSLPCMDADQQIEKIQEKTVSEVFAESGEAAFRDMETELLEKLVREKQTLVLCAGGGMPVREENRRLLGQLGTVVYLTADAGTLEMRLKGDCSRPLLAGSEDELRKKIEMLMKSREQIYLDAADLVIRTDGLSPDKICSEISVSLAVQHC